MMNSPIIPWRRLVTMRPEWGLHSMWGRIYQPLRVPSLEIDGLCLPTDEGVLHVCFPVLGR